LSNLKQITQESSNSKIISKDLKRISSDKVINLVNRLSLTTRNCNSPNKNKFSLLNDNSKNDSHIISKSPNKNIKNCDKFEKFYNKNMLFLNEKNKKINDSLNKK